MNRTTEFFLEMHKLRRRHIMAMFLMTFAVIAAWLGWCLKDMDLSRTNDGAAMIYINLLLMNTVLSPVVIAALASRMCDMEQMGDTYKWLCTIQNPEHIYRGKVITGGFYLIIFNMMQMLLFGAAVRFRGLGASGRQPALFSVLFLTSLCIFILQLNLSLRFTSQLTPLFISIGGTFAGLFSWFLYKWPLRFIIPWGYYAALCNTGYDYDEVSRYTAYYWDPYPVFWTAALLAMITGLYCFGRNHFMKIVRETM